MSTYKPHVLPIPFFSLYALPPTQDSAVFQSSLPHLAVMSPKQHQSDVSLPSIHEMFPEHLMEQFYDERSPTYETHTRIPHSRTSSALPVTRSDLDHPSSSDILDGRPRRPVILGSEHHGGRAHRNVRDPYQPNGSYDVERPSAVSMSHPTTQQTAAFSFDVLRPHPLTADLENVASSTNASVPPRIPHSSAIGNTTNSTTIESTVASIQKARPTFRVHLHPTSSSTSGNSSMCALPSAQTLRNEARRAFSHMPPHNFSPNAYLSSQISPHSAPHLQRSIQAPVAAHEIVDDRKHCCPHCDKRFNRPSSLNIHVNTHTGAKPFECPYPGCSRRFNVNSNMRRHWRNHLTARRRDAVARMIQPQMNITATPFISPVSSPPSEFSRSLSLSSSSVSSTSRSPSPQSPCFSDSNHDDEMAGNAAGTNAYSPTIKQEAEETSDIGDISPTSFQDRCRMRSRSSPVPRYRADNGLYSSDTSGSRNRSNSCTIPGCGCQPISTTLRPAFPDASIR